MQAQALVSRTPGERLGRRAFAPISRGSRRGPSKGPAPRARVATRSLRVSASIARRARSCRPAKSSTSRSTATGWLAVQARDGTEAYVRGGSLKVNSLGLLETERGELVLGDNGPLAVPPYTQIALAADGTLSIVPQGQGSETLAQIGRLKLVNPEVDRLGKRPDGLIEVTDGEEIEPDANVMVASGFIETSNVNIASTLVDMIEFQRQFEVAVRMMQMADENASRAADLASIS